MTRCACAQAEGQHHHGFGGTYPCAGPVDCIQCQPVERKRRATQERETR